MSEKKITASERFKQSLNNTGDYEVIDDDNGDENVTEESMSLEEAQAIVDAAEAVLKEEEEVAVTDFAEQLKNDLLYQEEEEDEDNDETENTDVIVASEVEKLPQAEHKRDGMAIHGVAGRHVRQKSRVQAPRANRATAKVFEDKSVADNNKTTFMG